jgi:hypothetical protein
MSELKNEGWWYIKLYFPYESIHVSRWGTEKPRLDEQGSIPNVIEYPVLHLVHGYSSSGASIVVYVDAEDLTSAMQMVDQLYKHYRARWQST